MVEHCDDQAAEAMGLSHTRLQHAWNVIRTEIAREVTPSVVAMVMRKGKLIRFAAGSTLYTDKEQCDVDYDTIYDCASLTKVVVTLPLILMLIDQGRVRLKDTVALFLPEFGVNNKAHVTVGHLLTHTSGLAPFYDLHTHGWSRDKIMSFIYECPLQNESGKQMVYSDLGFILLGEIISKLLGMTLDQAAQTYLFEPLGMSDSSFCMSDRPKSRIAATEFDTVTGDYLHGVVHDENARAMGGICGHAGLFSTAEDLLRYASLWLEGGQSGGHFILSRSIIKAATVPRTNHLPIGRRGLGWALQGDPYDASGDLLSPAAYGHTGYTGTSLYIDPVNELAAVILTNRVHLGRSKSVVRLRDYFHNAIVAAID